MTPSWGTVALGANRRPLCQGAWRRGLVRGDFPEAPVCGCEPATQVVVVPCPPGPLSRVVANVSVRGVRTPTPLRVAAFHNTDQCANNRVECDHGRLKARLRPMRGVDRDGRYEITSGEVQVGSADTRSGNAHPKLSVCGLRDRPRRREQRTGVARVDTTPAPTTTSELTGPPTRQTPCKRSPRNTTSDHSS